MEDLNVITDDNFKLSSIMYKERPRKYACTIGGFSYFSFFDFLCMAWFLLILFKLPNLLCTITIGCIQGTLQRVSCYRFKEILFPINHLPAS